VQREVVSPLVWSRRPNRLGGIQTESLLSKHEVASLVWRGGDLGSKHHLLVQSDRLILPPKHHCSKVLWTVVFTSLHQCVDQGSLEGLRVRGRDGGRLGLESHIGVFAKVEDVVDY